MKKTLIISIVILAIAALFLPRFIIHLKEGKKLDAEAGIATTPSVKVLKMKAETKQIDLVLPSYLEAINVTPLWARTNGYLKNFLVDIGDRVREGQLLAEIDTPDIDEELATAEGELLSFIAKENIAMITANRWVDLYAYNSEAISKEEVDQNVAAFEAAIADVEAAKANVDRLRYLQDFKYIYAPFDGIIVKRGIDIGTLISSGSIENQIELFQIARTDVLRAFVDVPQSLFYYIKDGLSASMTVWEYPGKAFNGIVDRFAGGLDPHARTLLTQVNIDNRNGELMPGLYAEVKFSFTPEQKIFAIPVGALIIRSGPPYVAIVNNNTIQLQKVEIGRAYGKSVEILKGLNEGMEIITNPTDLTKQGMKVKTTPLSKEEESQLLNP